MDLLVKVLPIDLVYMILNYICYPQPKELTEDIVSYVSTHQMACNVYYNKWVIEMGNPVGEDSNWLENDLILYANEGVPTMLGVQPKCKEIFDRFCNYGRECKLDFYVFVMTNKLTAKTRANMLLGLLTKVERAEFSFLEGVSPHRGYRG
jgi:hypothetical protein